MPLIEVDPKTQKKRIFIYGDNGSGKTHLSLTCPGKKLLIDWFANAIEVAQSKFSKDLEAGNIKIVKGPQKWMDINQMVKTPLDPLIDWADTVILDNLTGMYREITEDVAQNLPMKGNEGYRPSPEVIILRDYGLSAERVRYVLGKVLDNLAPTKHLIAICHTKLNKDKEGAVISGNPSLPGEVPAYTLSLFPEQIYLRATSDGVRHAHFTHTGLFPATTRILDGKTVDSPDLSKIYKWT